MPSGQKAMSRYQSKFITSSSLMLAMKLLLRDRCAKQDSPKWHSAWNPLDNSRNGSPKFGWEKAYMVLDDGILYLFDKNFTPGGDNIEAVDRFVLLLSART